MYTRKPCYSKQLFTANGCMYTDTRIVLVLCLQWNHYVSTCQLHSWHIRVYAKKRREYTSSKSPLMRGSCTQHRCMTS